MKQTVFFKSLLLQVVMLVAGTDIQAKEAYAVMTAGDFPKLTFYYDDQKASRNGMDIGPFGSQQERGWHDISGMHIQSTVRDVEFDSSFADYTGLTSTAYWFYGCQQLKTITGIENLKTDNVTDMSYMFGGCTYITSLDVSHFNTSKVTNMSGMFYGCRCVTSLDLSHFDTSNVTNMGNMFNECASLTSIDVSHFNTSKVTDMNCLFYECRRLTSLDVTNFDTSNVTDMHGLFFGCRALTSLDVSNFDTSNVTQMYWMFEECDALVSLDLSNFNTSNVTAMEKMFAHCYALASIDLSSFNTSKVTWMGGMFLNCKSLTVLDLSTFDTSNVTSMSSMFDNCESLTTIYGSNWDTSKSVHPYSNFSMFQGCNKLVGGKGTTYYWRNVDETYARIDQGKDAPGYFTDKNPTSIQPTTTDYRPFIEEGKVWTYHYYNDFTGKEFYESLTVSGDTVVDNKSYKKIVDVATGRVYCALREEGGKVYANYPNYSGENLIYDFGLNVGDAFPLYEGSDPWATVVSVDTIVVGNRSFRALDVRPNDAKGWPNWWVEGIGGMYHLTSNSIMPGNFYSFSSCQLDGDTLFTSRDFQTLRTIPSPETVIPMVQEGRTWYCQDIYPSDPHSVDPGYYEHDSAYYVIPKTYVLRGDTTIAGYTYKKMYCNERYCCAMRQNGQKVFSVLDGTEEELLDYDFGMVKSMSLMRDIITHERLSIENVDTVYVEGIARKRFMIYDDNKMLADIWIEGIGSKEGPMARWRWESTTPEHRMVSCMQGDKLLFSHLDFYPQTDINPVDKIAYRPFIEEDKVWKVGTISGNPVQVVDYYYFDGDTIVGGKPCKQMMCQRFVSPDYANEYWTPEPSLSYVGAWYEEGQKVYFYDEQKQSMVMKYDFTLDANETVSLYDNYPPFIIGPKQTGELEGFKGVYRDVMNSQSIKSTTWLEGVGGIDGPIRNAYAEAADHATEFLMSCTVGDEVIYLNDEYEDGATPEFNEARDRIDFTHTIKIKPKAPKVKAPRRIEAMSSLYGEYNDQQLGINLNSLDDAYQVSITDEAGKAVYEKTVDAGTIVGLNIDISTYAKGCYTVTVENSREVFTGIFETLTTGIEEARNKKAVQRGTIYDLQGRLLLGKPSKGLYIQDGKKYLAK